MSIAIFTFGRFNPPTIGHMALVDRVKTVAKQKGGKSFVFTGQSTDAKKNPLPYRTKTSYMKKSFKDVTVVASPSIKTIFDALGYLDKKKYKEVILVVGSDRVSEFKKLITKYLGDYNITSFKVVSAGERDPDASGVKGMSASKMREAAGRGDYDAFLLGCPKTLKRSECKQLFRDIQKGMGVREHLEESWFNYNEFEEFVVERKISIETRRKMGRSAKRTAKRRAKTRQRRQKFRKSSDTLKLVARKQAKSVLRKKIIGDADWSSLSISQRASIDNRLAKKSGAIDKIAKKLLPKVKVAERERLQKLRGSTPGQTNESEKLLREPEILDRLVQQLKDKGIDNNKAHAIAASQLQKHGVLKKGSQELTDKGKKRNSMTPSERAKDRAAKKDGNSPKEYKYNKKTNIATQKEELMKERSEDKPLLKWMEVFRSELKRGGSSYDKVDPVDALKLYYKGVDAKKAASQLKESVELDEAKTGDVEFTYPTTGQAKAFSNTLVFGGVQGVVVKRGKTVIFNISDLNKADKMGRKTLADLVQTARSNKAKIKSHGFTIESVELDEAIGRSTHYAVVLKGKVAEKGNKKEMLKKVKSIRKEHGYNRKELFLGMTSKKVGEKWPTRKTESRDYKKEYATYHSRPEQRANRSKRVLARRELEKQGRVSKGDGNDVDHKDGNPQNNSKGNLRVLTTGKNRGRDNNKWRNEEHGAGDEGTPKALKKYKDFTPGENSNSLIEPTPKVKKKKINAMKTGTEGY